MVPSVGEPDSQRAASDDRHAAAGVSTSGAAEGRRVWWVVGFICCFALASAIWVKAQKQPEVASETSKKKPSDVSVRLVQAQTGALPLHVEYRGELDTDVAELAAQGTGRLLSVGVDLGDSFKKGDLLAKVDAREALRLLAEAQAQTEAAAASKARAMAQQEAAREEAQRGRRLLEEKLISEQQLTALRAQVSVLEAEVDAAEAERAAAA